MSLRTRLAIVADLHIGIQSGDDDRRLDTDPGLKLYRQSVELFARAIDEINEEPDIDAIIVMGDLTRDSELFDHQVARDLLSRFTKPYYLVIGNHDISRQRDPESSYPDQPHFGREEYASFYRDHGLPCRQTYYSEQLPGDVTLIVLDSVRSLDELRSKGTSLSLQDHGWIGAAQTLWLERTLEKTRRLGRMPLVAMHHSCLPHCAEEQTRSFLSPVFRFWRVADAERLRGVLNRYDVPLVLSGHLHAQSVSKHGGLVNLVTSSTVSYPHAWRVVEIADREIRIKSRMIESIPSIPDLQQTSREWLNEGIASKILDRLSKYPMLANIGQPVGRLLADSQWWSRFCDGTLDHFHADPALIPRLDPVRRTALAKLAAILNHNATWKQEQPDCNQGVLYPGIPVNLAQMFEPASSWADY